MIPRPNGDVWLAPAEVAEELTNANREWWRWHFAGQIAAAYITAQEGPEENIPRWAAGMADDLVAVLENENRNSDEVK